MMQGLRNQPSFTSFSLLECKGQFSSSSPSSAKKQKSFTSDRIRMSMETATTVGSSSAFTSLEDDIVDCSSDDDNYDYKNNLKNNKTCNFKNNGYKDHRGNTHQKNTGPTFDSNCHDTFLFKQKERNNVTDILFQNDQFVSYKCNNDNYLSGSDVIKQHDDKVSKHCQQEVVLGDYDSSNSDNDDESLIVLSPPKNTHGEKEIICIDSDSDANSVVDLHIHDVHIPNVSSTLKSHSPNRSKQKQQHLSYPSASSAPHHLAYFKSNYRSLSHSKNIKTSLLDCDSINDMRNARNDLNGGSGTGLGGFFLHTGTCSGRDSSNKVTEQGGKRKRRNKRTVNTVTTRSKAKQIANATKKIATATSKPKGKKKWRNTKKASTSRHYRRKYGNTINDSNNGSSVWNATERGFRPYHKTSCSSGGAWSSSGQSYMNVSSIDPGLGNAGGASIVYE